MRRHEQEKVEKRALRKGFDGPIPGRSARSRYAPLKSPCSF